MKTGFITAVCLAALIGLAFLLPSFLFGTVPSAEIRPAPGGKYELINTGRDSIYFTGYSPGDCLMSARFVAPGKTMPGVGLCGTGLGTHSVASGKSAILSTYLPSEAYAGDEIVVTCQVSGRVSGWNRLKQWAASEVPAVRRFVSPIFAPSIAVETEEFVAVDPTTLTVK